MSFSGGQIFAVNVRAKAMNCKWKKHTAVIAAAAAVFDDDDDPATDIDYGTGNDNV